MAAIDGSLPSPDRQGFRRFFCLYKRTAHCADQSPLISFPPPATTAGGKSKAFASSSFRGLGCASSTASQAYPTTSAAAAVRSSADWEGKRHRKRRAKLKKKERRGQSLPSALGSASTDLWCAPGIAFVTGDDSVDCLVSSRDLVGRGGILGVDRVPRDSMLFQHRTLLQGRDAYDRYRDWRLDVDNMTYEELLELGDKIGHVSTGLGEEEVACSIRKVKHSIFFDMRFSSEMESKCSICQEEYQMDDEVGKLSSLVFTFQSGHLSHFQAVRVCEDRRYRKQKKACGGMITSRALCTLSISRGISIRPLLRKIHGISDATKGKAGLVHPTALVHPDAILGENVSVGPFCTIGSAVKVGNSCRIHAGSHIMGRTELGDNCIVLSGAIVGADLPGQTIVGSNNVIGHYAAIGVQCQDLKYKAGDECFLIVGDNNDIREYTSIHRSSKSSDNTVIGSNNLIMGSCHIAHDCKIGNQNIFANNTLLAGHVVIEDFTHTGGAVVVHQFCHVGSYSFIGGGSVIVQDVPRYMMVSGDRAEIRGLNFEGLRRLGFPTSEVRAMRKAYRSIFMSNSSAAGCLDDRLTEVECNGEFAEVSAVSSMVKSIRDSFTESRRGICKFGSRLAS
ncbi:hypothetical protein HPP92_023101 [Vanilla planifolia]|uniref:UDP N-acetylglucosamine O-acyltransferase C-terminal domain-containing protein n=1 Tax=Vanilla planifolia TaxID=51239 RepID=A0A835PVZ4_VANPL|nr:hypothetical protein HPP92_023101 [Vanilla planifolia]